MVKEVDVKGVITRDANNVEALLRMPCCFRRPVLRDMIHFNFSSYRHIVSVVAHVGRRTTCIHRLACWHVTLV